MHLQMQMHNTMFFFILIVFKHLLLNLGHRRDDEYRGNNYEDDHNENVKQGWTELNCHPVSKHSDES